MRSVVASVQWAMLWLLFFMVCLGLGYPVLNRYDPTQLSGTFDSYYYYQIVRNGSSPALGEYAPRILVSYVAQPFYWLARGRIGSWDPTGFALLAANSMFTALAALLLVRVGIEVGLDPVVSLLGATLFLMNFGVSNLMLSGLVDSALVFLFTAMTWTAITRRWWLLPLWGGLGGLSKESWLPLSMAFSCGWWVTIRGTNRYRLIVGGWFLLTAASSATVSIAVMRTFAHETLWSYFLMSTNGGIPDIPSLLYGLTSRQLSHEMWYFFTWLLLPAVISLRKMPREWRIAALSALLVTLGLTAVRGPGQDLARAAFNFAGPMLSLAAAQTMASRFAHQKMSA